MRTPFRTSATALAICAGLGLTVAPAAGAATSARQASPAAALAAAAPSATLLQVGSRGTEVRQWQALLNRIFRASAVTGKTVAEDGVYGPGTAQATRAVQAHLRLRQDGVVGASTRKAVSGLGFATGAGGTSPSSGAHDTGRRLRAGMRGADVKEWQRILNIAIRLDRLQHAPLTQDGQFGPTTRRATIALQTQLKLTADGVVGPTTRQATGWLLEG